MTLYEGLSCPAKYEVCPSCHGRGSSSRYLGAFTGDDMAELGDEFREDYAAGHYDRECDECHGRTTVLVPDYAAMSESLRAEVEDYYAEIAESYAIERSEMRACGYY